MYLIEKILKKNLNYGEKLVEQLSVGAKFENKMEKEEIGEIERMFQWRVTNVAFFETLFVPTNS